MVKKILITGGLGYVGGRLAAFLAAHYPGQVVVATRQTNVPDVIPGVQTTLVDFDTPDLDLSSLLVGVEVVVHLAAMNEIDCVKYPLEAIEVNVKQTLRWLQAAEQVGVKKFVYFSTFHVYGASTGHVTEQALPYPTHPYSITHHAAEDYVLASRKLGKLDGIVVRLSNAFGAPLLPSVNRWTLLVNDLCKNVVQSGQLILQSDGSQERDFITLTDVCRATTHLIQAPSQTTQNGLFNLCSGQTWQVYQMAQKIADRYNYLFNELPPINRPAPPVPPAPGLICSAQKLKDTGFEFLYNVDQELDNMLLFCKHHFGSAS